MNQNLVGSIRKRSSINCDDFLEINQSETRIAFGSHVCQQIGTKLAIFIKDFPRMLPTISFDSFGQAVSEETIFLEMIG
jgi:hypothetical protein